MNLSLIGAIGLLLLWGIVVFGAHNGHHAHNGGAPPPSHVEQLERLAALHDSGALDDDEFAAEKALLV